MAGRRVCDYNFLLVVCSSFFLGYVSGGGMFTDCGGSLSEHRGTIQSPNFPDPFPIPINCRWIIQAPEQSKIVIYFTQYFLQHSFYITEYEKLEEKNVMGPFNAKDKITSLEVYKSYVVLDLVVTDDAKLNLRVEDFLMDVHGFNITYEIVPRHQETKESCSVHGCSALGNCLASHDYSSYSCSCFNGFYGKTCEKGPYCDPDKGMNSKCNHGGKCKYFYGSKVLTCVCPNGYDGNMCQKKPFNNECPKNHNCTHNCVKKPNNVLQCTCKTGFELESDGLTCKELQRYRIIVNMPVVEQDDIDDRLQAFIMNMHHNFVKCSTILSLVGMHPEGFQMDSVSNETLAFHFFLNKTELPYVDQGLAYLLAGGRFDRIYIDYKGTTIEKEPELKILSVENSDKGPALEGKLLTLTCVARGSDNLRFRWFKDGKSFDMSLTHRNAWEIRLPETISEMQISQLNIDGVTMYDKGRFTCKVSDFGQEISNFVDLDVMLLPQIEVTPMTISLFPGQANSFRCLSPDDSKPSFTYSWLKNGRPIKETDEEGVEDLQPSGSRLLINEAKEYANYTCQVTNKAGTASRTVYLFVGQVHKSGYSCNTDIKDGIKWNKTLGGYFNLQKCPTDHSAPTGEDLGEEKSHASTIYRRGGFTKRRCECTRSSCKWMKPNNSGCQSIHLIKLFHRVRRIQQGYREFQLDDIYKQLYHIARMAHGRMLAGDLDITATTLYLILTTARDFPSLIHSSFDSHEIVDFLNIVLEKTISMTEDEKEDLQTGARVVQIVEILTELHKHDLINLTSAKANKIAMDVRIVQEQTIETVKMTPITHSKSAHVKRDVEEVDIKKATQVLSAHYDQSILKVLNANDGDELQNDMFLSDVISIVPLERKKEKASYYLVEIPHRSDAQGSTHRKSTNFCYSWERKDRETTEGEWRPGSCHTIEMFKNMTRCACLIPGHFTVVTVPVNQTVLYSEPGDSFIVLIVACSLSICCIGIGLAVYLISWRYLRHVKHGIHLNFLLSLLGLNATCLMCILKTDNEAMCICGKILLQFFLVAAFTFLFLDGVQLFAGIHISLYSLVSKGCCKFAVSGWAVAVLSVVCVVTMMELIGYDQECNQWCFWDHYQHHFYSILIPIIILIMCHTVVSLLCIFIIIKWNSDYHYRKRWKMLLEYGRSESILILLILLFCVSTLNVKDKGLTAQVLFLVFDLLLVISSVLMYCLLKKPMRLSLRHLCNCSLHLLTKEEFPVLSNYIPPGVQQERSRVEAEQIHDYCDRVDQERYTSKHRRQLRFLLTNSSASSSSSGACCSGPSENGNSKDSWAPRTSSSVNNADSGISEGTESEKSLSQVREEGRNSFQPDADGAGCVSSQKQKQTGRKMQHKSGKKSKSKHKASSSSSKEGSRSQESQVFSKSSTQTSELNDIEIGVQEEAEKKCDNESSSFLLGLRYGGTVKSPSEVNCLLQEEGQGNSKL